MAQTLQNLSATEAAKQIREGTLTSESLVTDCLNRIEARDDAVRAWQFVDGERAIEEARARDRQPASGPLHGVPVGFKDIIETADQPTSYGSVIYENHQPSIDAACVSLVRRAGGVVLGKTVTTEFAFVNPSITRNPHNLEHSPGGSSSGSAAAVADAMVPIAFGTQTGGSIIRPASFNGVVGYKPTFGSYSYAGVKLLAGSLCTLGALSRSVEDQLLLREAMIGAPSIDVPQSKVVGFCRTPWWDSADADSKSAVEAAANSLASHGVDVREVELPSHFEELVDLNATIMRYEGLRNLATEIDTASDQLSDALKDAMFPARELSYAQYAQALDARTIYRMEFDGIMNDLDALIVPSATGEAPKGFATTGDSVFNAPWTTLGVPCVTLPGYVGEHGLPVGVQLVSGRGADDSLLALGAWAQSRILQS